MVQYKQAASARPARGAEAGGQPGGRFARASARESLLKKRREAALVPLAVPQARFLRGPCLWAPTGADAAQTRSQRISQAPHG